MFDASAQNIINEFWISNCAFYDIKMNRKCLLLFKNNVQIIVRLWKRKTATGAKPSNVDETVFTWYKQQRFLGVPVKATEIFN